VKGEGFIYRPRGREMDGQDARMEECRGRVKMHSQGSTWIVLVWGQ
jgi:hypothetical protein